MGLNYFKAFISAAPYCFAKKEHWYVDKRDRPWDIFLPCIDSYNLKRKQLINTILLILDESMSGWRPHTSRLGGLPNCTYEPRKPVSLGTMFRNGAECKSGIMVFQDVVQNAEVQGRKEYSDMKSNLGDGANIASHTAEVLRQTKGAGVERGGWVGGDAWFGSVGTCVELKKQLGVYSTFVVKNNTNFFPMMVLHRLLEAKYGDRPAGHWVSMSTCIAGVHLFVIVYAWSQRGLSYFVSTCGDTTPHETKYMSYFEDDFGNVNFKELSRPSICHYLYEFLPIIDEHNKQRQNISVICCVRVSKLRCESKK